MANAALSSIEKRQRRRDWGHPQTLDLVTLRSVVNKTFLTVAIVVFTAGVTWFAAESFIDNNIDGLSTIATMVFPLSLVTLGLSIYISLKNSNPFLIFIFCLFEGVLLGLYSMLVVDYVGNTQPVFGALLGTFAAAFATLFVYKSLEVRVTTRFRKYVAMAMIGMIFVSVADAVLYLFGSSIGVHEFGTTAIIFSAIGVIVACFMLLTDFDSVERSINMGLPQRESWRLAWGITVSLIWLYIHFLKIFASLNRR